MADSLTGFPALGVYFPRFLLPVKEKVDLNKWAVIACDQYTSEEDYWKRVEIFVGNAPSTLRLTFPEVYLDKGRDETIIKGIASSMRSYEALGFFSETKSNGIIIVERTTRAGLVRRGLMLALDLEQYSFKPGSKTLIRATEKTIESRIPPRLAVRRAASIELPHIIVLIDDDAPSDEDLISSLHRDFCQKISPAYDTELMENSGSVRGFFIDDQRAFQNIQSHLASLRNKSGDPALLFAVGDGNHSLATAKALWEETKLKNPGLTTHPARFALVEVQNCRDTTLEFEPINRLIFGNACLILTDLKTWFEGSDQGPVTISFFESNNNKFEIPPNSCSFGFVINGTRGVITLANPKKILPVASLTDFIDDWLVKHGESRIDYVHEMGAIERFCATKEQDNIGFVFAPMDKSDLFRTVINEGALPRKTFSMGSSHDKRFYLEARYIV